jgi:hypothetical protein
MRSRRITRLTAVCLCILLSGVAALPGAIAAEKKSYILTTIKGKLTYPGSGKPMSGAQIRFTPIDPDLPRASGVTQEDGSFVVEGLGYGDYVIEIETEDGETIHGINALPIEEGKPVVLDLKLSDRVVSSTSLENEPDRFMAVVAKDKQKKGKFWKQFGIFVGLVILVAALF